MASVRNAEISDMQISEKSGTALGANLQTTKTRWVVLQHLDENDDPFTNYFVN